ncbi:MAG: hypothetical protein ABJB55_09225 [Actinomycetota bacterium]
MRGKGRAWLAIALAALAVAGATAAESLGPATPLAGTSGSAVSSVWLCPHGGGRGWTGTIEIANPGDGAVQARLYSLGDGARVVAGQVEVPPRATVSRDVPAGVRAAATEVQIFGGWAGVGWIVRAGGSEAGMGAEPCTSEPGSHWTVVDGATTKQSHSYLVVMNPFATDAVIDVALFLAGRPPVRDTKWTDLPILAGHAVALDLGTRALGEAIVGADVTATRGRIVVGSLVVGSNGSVRSSIAAPGYASRWILPVAGGSGAGTVSLLVPGDLGIRFGGTLLQSQEDAQTAGNLTVVRQGGTSTVSEPVTTTGASAVILALTGDGVVSAGIREAGRGLDDASTGGTAIPGPAWVVLPIAIGGAPVPALVLVNPGDTPVTATAYLLDGGGEPVSITVAARRTAAVPVGFLRRDLSAGVLVRADGDLVALGAGTSGPGQTGWYAMALGVPVPTTTAGLPVTP